MSIKYITKPVIVEAVQWTGHNQKAIETLLESDEIQGLDNLPVGAFIVKLEDNSFISYTEKDFHNKFQRDLVWEDNI